MLKEKESKQRPIWQKMILTISCFIAFVSFVFKLNDGIWQTFALILMFVAFESSFTFLFVENEYVNV